jgi:hypothetical protein
MQSNHVLIAHIESLDVDMVKDLRIGLSPSKAAYMSRADFAVARRCWFLGDREEVGST